MAKAKKVKSFNDVEKKFLLDNRFKAIKELASHIDAKEEDVIAFLKDNVEPPKLPTRGVRVMTSGDSMKADLTGQSHGYKAPPHNGYIVPTH